jgi:hypothetical protein
MLKNLSENGDKPKEVVFVVENNKAVMKEVKTGLSDDNYIEIKADLKEENRL